MKSRYDIRQWGVILTGFCLVATASVALGQEPPAAADADMDRVSESVLPAGTLSPITLKAALQKTRELPLTLEQALKLAQGQNIEIRIAEETVQQRRLDTLYRLSDLLPDVSAQYTQSRFVGAVQIFGGELFEIYRTTYQPMLMANYTIYSGGRNLLEIRASRQRQEAQKNLLEDARQDILTQVAVAYYDLQQAYWQRAITLQTIQEAELQVEINRARYQAGTGLKLDLLQAQTFLSNRRLELINVENLISKTSERLSQLLALDFEVSIVPDTLESTIHPIVPENQTATALLKIAKQHNPRLKSLHNLRNASRTDVRVAVADLFPKIDITGYVSGTGPALSNLGLTRFGGLQVSMDLLENLGFGKSLKIQQARNNARIAELTLAQADRVVQENLANALIDLQTLKNRIEVARESVNFAKAAYEQALGRLREGVGDTLDLETATTRLANARTDLAAAFISYNRAQVMLLSQLGLVSVTSLTQGYPFDGTTAVSP